MTDIRAMFFVDGHLSAAKLTNFLDGNCILIASTVSEYSIWPILARVMANGSTNSLHNMLYDCIISRIVIVFQGISAKTNSNMR